MNSIDIPPILLQSITKRLQKAQEHGPIVDNNHLLGIIAEEYHELTVAVHSNDNGAVADEALCMLVVSLRYLLQQNHVGLLEKKEPQMDLFERPKQSVLLAPPNEEELLDMTIEAYEKFREELPGPRLVWEVLGPAMKKGFIIYTKHICSSCLVGYQHAVDSLVDKICELEERSR